MLVPTAKKIVNVWKKNIVPLVQSKRRNVPIAKNYPLNALLMVVSFLIINYYILIDLLDCYARRLLSVQPDFVSQKCEIEESITKGSGRVLGKNPTMRVKLLHRRMYRRKNPHSLHRLLLSRHPKDSMGRVQRTSWTPWTACYQLGSHEKGAGEGSLYIEEMHDKWHEATQRGGQRIREFGAYLQSIRSVLLDLDEAGARNEKQLMHRMRQGLRPEIRAAIFRIPTIPKD